MKIGVKKTGDWQSVRTTLLRRKERLEAMRRRLMRDLVEKFEEEVKAPLPNTPEMAAYKKSIVKRELAGSFKEGQLAYALISDPEMLNLNDLGENSHVIYVLPSGSGTTALGQLLTKYSPWVKSRLPKNLKDVTGIRLVHRQVSDGEVDKVRELNDRILKDRAGEFKQAGAQIPPRDDILEPPKSMPDIMFQALRMEFGIKMTAVPHWKRARDRRMNILKGLFKDKKRYTRYVADPNFNGWTQRLKKWKKISAQRFSKQYGQFDKKISGE